MAQICTSSFSSSPPDSLFNECWSFNHLPTVESYDTNILIKHDPDLPDLFEDLQCSYSISNDILRMTEDNAAFGGGIGGIGIGIGIGGSESDDCGDFNPNIFDGESKVRNKNLMWSGSSSQLSTSASSSVSDNGALVPLAFVTGGFSTNNNTTSSSSSSTQQQQQQQQQNKPPTVVVANNKARNSSSSNNNNNNNRISAQQSQQQQQQQQNQSFALHSSIKLEPFDDYEQQLQQHNIPNSKTTTATTPSSKILVDQQNLQHIPPGTSLLRKSNTQQQQRKQQQKLPSIQIPKIYTSEFVRERDQLLTTTTLNAPPVVTTANNKHHHHHHHQQSSSSSSRNLSSMSPSSSAASTIGLYGRPDTPHSLDDESALMYNNSCNNYDNDNDNDHDDNDSNTTGFRHQVDLRACIMGSNNISLTATDPTPLINHLSQQLQDTSKDQIDLPFIGGSSNRSLAEVLDYINDKDIDGCDIVDGGSSLSTNSNNTTTATDRMTYSMRNLRTSGYDSDEESLGGLSTSSSLINEDSFCMTINSPTPTTTSSTASTATTSPVSHHSMLLLGGDDSSSSSPQYLYTRSQSSSSTAQQQLQQQKQQLLQQKLQRQQKQQKQQQQQQPQQQQSYLHSDHSYTRCKDGLDDLRNLDHLDTPSDSDEEIDVVSIGDKKLPTNPSDKDRRVIQTKVACKFANPRLVKNGNGSGSSSSGGNSSIRTIPPRSRGSFELPYSPANSSPVKSVANSRYPSPASTPYHNQYTSTPLVAMNSNSEKSRKRLNGLNSNASVCDASSVDYALPPYKKCRGKKQQSQVQQVQQQQLAAAAQHINSSNAAASITKRHYSSDETTDTIEKRNLHNDMERQRRIGLKNLFDMLKKQIPSIKDKERAPKVNILREAAKLCESLTREDEQLSEQKVMLKEQMSRRSELLERLRNMKRE